MQALHTAAARLEHTVVQLTDEISDKILTAAVELATVLLGQELTDPQVAATAALTRVLAVAPDNEPVTIWLGSQDFETITAAGPDALIGASARRRRPGSRSSAIRRWPSAMRWPDRRPPASTPG